jgi:hypothetical protein
VKQIHLVGSFNQTQNYLDYFLDGNFVLKGNIVSFKYPDFVQ